MFKYILFLILLRIKIIYTLKQCDDCVVYTSCPNAMELARRQVHADIFQTALCGRDISQSRSPPMVCCSDFAAAAGNTGTKSIGVQNGVPESDQVERTTPTAARADGACVCDSVDTEVHPNAGLLPDACGVGDGEIEEKGHAKAGLYEFPWMALIFFETRDLRDFRCAGTIINSRYILTAANCMKTYGNIAGVRVGEYNLCTSVDCRLDQCESHIQNIPVDEAIVHENYTSQVNYIDTNDIALLRLHDPIDFTFKNVAPICLPLSNALRSVSIDGKTATLASWKFKHTRSCALNKISFPLITTDECVNKYEKSSKNISINHICTDEKEEYCYNIIAGDPLMLDAGDERGRRMVQYGISSHGPTRCGTDYPGVYTNVSKYMDWILSNLKK